MLTSLRQLVKVHASIVRDSVRVQNRLKAMFRSRGVRVTGKSVYSAKSREKWLEQLAPSNRVAVSRLYDQLEALLDVRETARKDLVAESHRHPAAKTLETCPGLGEIRGAQMIAVVMTPDRFRTRQQSWSYCGLGIVTRSSSDWVQTSDGRWARVQVQKTRGLNRTHNTMLKAVFKGASTTRLTAFGRPKSPRVGYAPPESRTKQWPTRP